MHSTVALLAPSARSSILAGFVLSWGFLSSSCSDETTTPPPPACEPVAVDAGCAPLYEPGYDQIFARTFKPTCAASGVSCHASTGKQGGIDFSDHDAAYAALTAAGGAVTAGDPSCSRIVTRITATSGKVRMPPGRSLDPAEQCTIIQWIANGAKK